MLMMVLGGALLVGCAVGPNFQAPAAPNTQTYTAKALPSKTAKASVLGGTAQHFKMGEKIPDQ